MIFGFSLRGTYYSIISNSNMFILMKIITLCPLVILTISLNAQNGIQTMLLKLENFLVSLSFPGARSVVVFERIHNAHFIHKHEFCCLFK